MFDPEHLAKFCEGPKAWNAWRNANPNIVPELSDIRLTLHQRQLGASNGGPIDLHTANLELASLSNATLTGADLSDARLVSADLTHARLDGANLSGADLTDAILDHADLMGASLDHAVLFGTDLSNTRNLTVIQLELAYGDASTRLPGNIAPPQSWFPVADYDDDDDYSGWIIGPPVEENLYEILGLTLGASNEGIRTAYRGLVKKLHPDINPNNEEAQERFKRVSIAYRILNDPVQRQRYDRGEIDGEGRVNAEFEARRQFRRTVFRYSGAAVGSFFLATGALVGVWWTVLSTEPRDEAVRVAASQPKNSERLGEITAPAKPTKDEPRTAVSSQGSRRAAPEPSVDSRVAALPEDAAPQVPPAETPRPPAPDIAAPAPSGDSRVAALPEDAAPQVPPAEMLRPAAPDVAAPAPSRDSRQEQETETGTEQLPAPKPVAVPPSSTAPDLATAPSAAAPGNGTAAPPTAANEATPASPPAEDTRRPLQERHKNTADQTAPSAADRESVAALPQGGPERKASPGSDSRLIGAEKQRPWQSWQEPTARDLASQVLRDQAIAQSLGKKAPPVMASNSDGILEHRAGLSQEAPTNALPSRSRPRGSAALKRATPVQQRKSQPPARVAARRQAPRSASIAADDAAQQRQVRQQQMVSDVLAGGL